ncbi:transcription factor GAGA isoform X2 [Cephus cinctus]|uniref:Transcription factor GAGA isoform X2 n=1 Tax=Cephus cinctus TaxID=211228 RepID=A0AAJ7R7Q2_CEPCN|nr:transcription factor GAGA isoform X2 [Cephus cinctus]
MSSQICLKWNSFLSNIATSFESLWEEEGLVDVTLASDGQCLTAHKVILSASSPFFKKVFQTNPCQHPVIILQDVHFSELEALLIFIYKGEVNIEQKNLPALLKAAETLQIRGLSGGDVFAKESYKRLAQLEQAESQDSVLVHEETPKKKQKIGKLQNNSILEKALTPQISQSESTSESTANEQNFKDSDLSEPLPSPIYHRLEMKMEPFDIPVEEFEKDSSPAKDLAKRLDTGQTECTQESPGSPVDTSKMDAEKRSDFPEGHSLSSESNPGISQESFPSFTNTGISEFPECSQSLKGAPAAYPPFPCPFCDRAYTSWGFRRRHIKAVHTISPSLNCKWCLQVLPSHAAWRRHVISAHNLSASDAHNGLLILEEAHMVLQIAHPTRLDTLVNIIKQSSQQNSGQDNA